MIKDVIKLKKMISFILTLLSSVMILFPFVTANADTKEVKTDVPPNILFLGDSIATGFGLEGYENGRENCASYANTITADYAEELKDKCKTSMKNLAVDGQTSGELLQGLILGTYDEDLKNADAVVISIGGNDLLTVLWDFVKNDLHININDSSLGNSQHQFNISQIIDSLTSIGSRIDKNLEAFDANLSQIAQYINSKSNGVIVVQTLYNPFDRFEQKQVNEFIREKITALNSYIETHKNDDGAEYIVADVYSDFYGRGNELTRIKEMDIHPNQEGHNVIAECVNKTIRTENYSYLVEVKDNPAQSNSVNEKSLTKYLIVGVTGIIAATAIIIFVYKIKTGRQGD